jgi:RNA polymerase sigma factor (sigma-70 family)
MQTEARKYDLDLSRMADEALVILAQECAFRPAIDELVLRHYGHTSKLIALKAKCMGLAADVPDAQQNAVFAMLEAIAGYNTLQAAQPRGCRFRTYLRLVVLARFGDFVKQLRRLQRRCGRLDEAGERLAAGPGRCPGCRTSDPVEALARQEAMARLQQALEGLDEALRRLWRELANGKKLRQIAREQGVSYDRVKRQRRRLLGQLAAQLRHAWGD